GIRRIAWIDQYCDPGSCRHQFTQKSQPLGVHFGREKIEARRIAARMREARDKAQLDRVFRYDESNWNRLRGSLGRDCSFAPRHRAHAPLTAAQTRRQFRQAIETARQPIFDCNVPALDVAAFRDTPAERIQEIPTRSGRNGGEKPDNRHLSLLRSRPERPCRCRAAEKRDELAPLHSITSSARASSAAGTSMPSALAVLRLMTSSYLVGACTWRSAGVSPSRMRST